MIEPRPEISIVVPTCGRPEQLERCLLALFRQSSARKFEIVVADNAPRAGGVRELIERYPEVRLVVEGRKGISFARNAGVRAARGEILVFTDDDAEAAPDWLENLLRPFERTEVAAVTGNTLPWKVETEAERLFEAYGGFSRGDAVREFGPSWLRSRRWWLPLWQVGGTGNAAFRASVFHDPAVGLLDERLGGGSPAGTWSDLYFFYRLLRAGYLIVYEPRAVVRHAHRESLAGLSRQLEAYRRGEVVCCLLLLGRHRDARAIPHLFLWIPYWRATQLAGELLRRMRGERRFHLRIMMREWLAYLQGPAALLAHREPPGGLPIRREESPPTALQRHQPAGVSIVIPVYNAVEFAQACVESLYEAQTSVPFEVIVVDNGSGPEVAAWLACQQQRRPGLVALRFNEPLGFARAVNEGARHAKRGNSLVLLNSDTVVTDGWLDGLENALAFDPQLGVVSPVTNYAGNGLQIDPEAAALDALEARRYAARIRDRKELLPEPQRLVFFCVMIQRALWDSLEGLDEGYLEGNSEDNDFCLRARLAGYRLAVVRNAFVFHHPGSTTFRANAIDHDAAMTRNQLRFCDRASAWARSLTFFDGRGSQWIPNVSVIVPVMAGQADDLRDSLASLVNQTARGFQTVVVSRQREELTPIIQAFEGRLRIAHVVVDEELGDRLAALLNAGLAAADRQWIAYLPAGDVYYAYHIELLAEALRGSQAEAVYAAWSLVDRAASEANARERRAAVALHGTAPDQLGLDNQPPLLCWMHARGKISDKEFDESFQSFSSLEFVLWMSRRLKAQYVPRVTCERRLGAQRGVPDPLRQTQARRLLEAFPSSESWQDENRVRFLEAVEAGSWKKFPLMTPHAAVRESTGARLAESRLGRARSIPQVAIGAARETYRALVPLQIRYGIERRARHLLGLPPVLRTDWQKLNAARDALAKAILQTTRLPRPPGPVDVLLFSVVPWDHLVQRPHHFARGLAARGHRVYWVDIMLKEPDRLDPASLVREIEPGLFYVALPGAGGAAYHLQWSAEVLAAMEMAVVHIRSACGIEGAIQLVNYPKWAPLVFRLRDRFGWPVVYDCLDDRKGLDSVFNRTAPDFEEELAQRCELMVTCSHLLDEARRPLNPNTVLILNAGDYHQFHSAKPAGLLQHLPRPILGFFGAFSDWLDLDWVAQSAQRFPNWSFVYIGRQGFVAAAMRERWKALSSEANIHVFPQADPQTLASYLAEFDVCTMPFRVIAFTRVMNAVKIYEYLAAGKPVVISDVAELRPLAERGLISIYRDTEHSFRLLEQAVQTPGSAEQIAARLAFASENTWTRRVDQLEAAILPLTAATPSREESGVSSTRRTSNQSS